MGYEDPDEIKEKLYEAYMKACVIVGDSDHFVPVRVNAFKNSKLKFSVRIDEV